MSNYTTDAINFNKSDINNIIAQCKDWSGLGESAKLAWLNEFYTKCLDLQGFPLVGAVDVKDISLSARASGPLNEIGKIEYRQSDFNERDFVEILYLFFHELHHIKFKFLRCDKNAYKAYANNKNLQEIIVSHFANIKCFSDDVNNALLKLLASEFSADKFAKKCMMYLFNKVQDKNIKLKLLKRVMRNNEHQYREVKCIEESKELTANDMKLIIKPITEVKTEAKRLKKLHASLQGE